MSDCEYVPESSCLNCSDNFVQFEAITNESRSDNPQAGHINNSEIISIAKYLLPAPSLSIIEIQTENEEIESEKAFPSKIDFEEGELCTTDCENIAQGQNDTEVNKFRDLYVSKPTDCDLPAGNLPTKRTSIETKSKLHDDSLEDIMSSAQLFHTNVSENFISHNPRRHSENEVVYTHGKESICQGSTTTCIESISNVDDASQKYITDKYENKSELQVHEDLSTCNSERHISDDNSVISSNTTTSLLDVLGRMSSNNHQFESTTIPVIDDLKVSMKTLSIQSCVIEDSEEGHSSHKTSEEGKHVTDVDRQDEHLLRKTMQSAKKLLEIRERRKLKSVIEVKRKGSNTYKQRVHLAATASNSTTRLSITNKSFYDSIYGINMSAGSKKNPKLRSPTRTRTASKDVTSNDNDLVLKKSNETITYSCSFIDNILNEMGYEHAQHGVPMTKDRFPKDEMISKTVQSIDSLMSTVSIVSSDKYTAVPYTLSGNETMQPTIARNQKHCKEIKNVKPPSQNDCGSESKFKKISKKIQKVPLIQHPEGDYRFQVENKQRRFEIPDKSVINSETSSKASKTTKAQIKCKKSIDKIYNLMRRIDSEYNMYEPTASTAHHSLRTIKENSSHMESNRRLCSPCPRVNVTSSSSSNDIIEKYSHKNYTLKVPKIIINAKTQLGKTDLRKVTEKLPTTIQYNSNTQPTVATKSTVRKSESNFEKSKVNTDVFSMSGRELKQTYDTKRNSHREQDSEIKKKFRSRDTQRRISRLDEHVNMRRLNIIPFATPGESKKRTHPTFSENTKFTLADKHTQEMHRRVMDLRDEEREARGEAVRGPPNPRVSNQKDYIKRLDTLAQPKRAYVQAHCEEFKHKLAPVMSNRLSKIISLSHSKTKKTSIKQRTVAGVEGFTGVKDLGRYPQHSSGGTQVQERRTRSGCSLTSHTRSTLSHCSLSPRRESEPTQGSSSPADRNMYDTQSYILNHFNKQTRNGDFRLKSSISIKPNAYGSITSLRSEPNSEVSKNSHLPKSDYLSSDSNFHIFNECIHEFLNQVLSTINTQQADKIQTDDELSNNAYNNLEKIAKVRDGIVTVDSCELFDLNYGQTVRPFHSCQSVLYSFDVESNVRTTPITPNNLLASRASKLISNNNSVLVLSDYSSQALIKYMPRVISSEKGATNISNGLRIPNLKNQPQQAPKNILFLQAGDASRASSKVMEPIHNCNQSSSTSLSVDKNGKYPWTGLENFCLSRMPLTTVAHNISSKNIQYKKLVYLSHILNLPSIVYIATVWHRCMRYETIKNNNSNMNATLTTPDVHNWMNKKQTESFVKVLNILTELQGISNGLTQVVTIVGFQHIYHPVYVIRQYSSSFYYITSFEYIIYYETIKLQKDDYSKCLAPYGSFYSIYASDCGDLVCKQHAYIAEYDRKPVANNDTIPKSKWDKVEHPSSSVRVCNVCTSVQTLQTMPSISSLSSRTNKTSSTTLTTNKNRLTIFFHKQPGIVPSESTMSCLPNMAGDVKLPINIDLKNISTSSVSMQRLDVETKMKRSVLLTMYVALVVIIFSMLSLPQILTTILK